MASAQYFNSTSKEDREESPSEPKLNTSFLGVSVSESGSSDESDELEEPEHTFFLRFLRQIPSGSGNRL